MSRPTLFIALATCLTLLCANTAWAQGDQPPPPPPLGDTGDEPSGIDTDTTPPLPTRRPVATGTTKAKAENPEMPAVRATGKNMGLFFKFGGLATMTATGNLIKTGSAVLTNEVGIKFVFSEKFMLPIYFGFGVGVNKADGADDSTTDWNLSLGAGVEYHFRIWRRISPFFGGVFKFGFSDQTGDSNLVFNVGLGPCIGIEYYVADRISLSASYYFLIGIRWADSQSTYFGMGTTNTVPTVGSTSVDVSSGGKLTITAYF